MIFDISTDEESLCKYNYIYIYIYIIKNINSINT